MDCSDEIDHVVERGGGGFFVGMCERALLTSKRARNEIWLPNYCGDWAANDWWDGGGGGGTIHPNKKTTHDEQQQTKPNQNKTVVAKSIKPKKKKMKKKKKTKNGS